MKRILFFELSAVFFLVTVTGFSQKGIRAMVNAEKQFAVFTASHTIKEGFQQYMDSAGVIFRQGNEVNALETYQKQKADPGILSWEPVFAIISASGDMGATTGPYEFKPKISDAVTARGSFSSVWHINRQGSWKNLADLGVSYTAVYPAVQQVKEIVLPKISMMNPSGYEAAVLCDKKLNTAIQEKNVSGWIQYISTDSWLNMDGQKPATGMLQITEALQKAPPGLMLNYKAGEISSAKDLAYIYGTVVNGTKKENYLRVWIYRNKQWQAILQTLRW